MAHHLLDRRAIGERIATHEAIIQRTPKAVLIADRRQVGWVHDAFGTGTIQTAIHRIGGGHGIDERFALSFGQQAADAEVENAHLAVRADHEVGWFEQTVEQALLMALFQPLGGLQDVVGGLLRIELALAFDDFVERLALDERPSQVVHSAGRADIHKGDDGRMLALLEGTHFAACDAHVPHAAPRQNLDGVPAVVRFRLSLVDGAHAAAAQRVHEGERPQHETLRLALQQALRLELRQNLLSDEVLRQGRRLRAGILVEEFADDLIELAAIDQVASAQIPDEPFAGSEVRCQHSGGVLLE